NLVFPSGEPNLGYANKALSRLAEEAKLFLILDSANVDEIIMWIVQTVAEIFEPAIEFTVSNCVVPGIALSRVPLHVVGNKQYVRVIFSLLKASHAAVFGETALCNLNHEIL